MPAGQVALMQLGGTIGIVHAIVRMRRAAHFNQKFVVCKSGICSAILVAAHASAARNHRKGDSSLFAYFSNLSRKYSSGKRRFILRRGKKVSYFGRTTVENQKESDWCFDTENLSKERFDDSQADPKRRRSSMQIRGQG